MANDVKSIKRTVDENIVPTITFENNKNDEKIIVINDNKPSYTPNSNNFQNKNTTKDYIVLTPVDGSEPKIVINDKENIKTIVNNDYIIKIEDKIDASLLNLSNISSNDMGKITGELDYKINGEVVTLLKDGQIVGYTSLDELKRAYGTDRVEEVKEIANNGVLDGTNLDLSKISSTASDANNGNFINENKLHKDMFDKEIQYKVRDDGTVLLSKDGVALGFTTISALENALDGKVSNIESSTNTNAFNNQNSEGQISSGHTETSTDNIENESNIVDINTNLEAKADVIENTNVNNEYTPLHPNGTKADQSVAKAATPHTILNSRDGWANGPSGKETFYDPDVLHGNQRVIKTMREAGFDETNYPYHIREDGVRMIGDYIIVAANLDVHPRGSIVPTSLGLGMVCDTGDFAKTNPNQLDVSVNWSRNNWDT